MSDVSNFHHLASTLKFKQLELVCEIVKHRSLVKASEHMNMTQSAATKTLLKLEKTLDIKLFNRLGTGMEPTEIGLEFIEHAQIILAQLRHYAEQLSSQKDGTMGTITVGVLIDAATHLLPETIRRINQHYPKLKVVVIDGVNSKLVQELKMGTLDIIIGRLPLNNNHPEIVQTLLYNDTIEVVCAKDNPVLKNKNIKGLKDLMDCNWIFPLKGTSLRHELENSFYHDNLPLPENITESVSVVTNINLVKKANYIMLLPSVFISTFATENFVSIPIKLNSTLTDHGYQTKKNKYTRPSVKLFTEILHQVADGIKE